MRKVAIGTIVNTHGLKGELKILPDTDFQEFRYSNQTKLWVQYQNNMIPLQVLRYRIHKGFDLLTFKGYEDINLVEAWKGSILYAEHTSIPFLKANEFHIEDVINIEIWQGNLLKGTVSGVRSYPQGDYLEVTTLQGGKALIPFRDEFIETMNLETKRIDIIEMEGLL